MDEPASSKFSEPMGLEPEEEDSYRDMIQGKYSDDDLRLEPEDMDNPDEDLVIIGSGALDIENKFGESPSMTNGEYAAKGQEFVDDRFDGDKEAALKYIYSQINEDRDEEDEKNDQNLAIDDIPDSLRELSTELGYLNEVDGMEGGMDLNAMQYKKVEFVYTEQGGRFYGLDVYVSKDQPQRSDKLGYNEANEWLKDTLAYIHEGDLIPKKYNSGLEDLDLIVDRLRELGIEASHGDYMDVS